MTISKDDADKCRKLVDLLREVEDEISGDAPGRLIDEQDLLTRWSEGRITRKEHEALMEHLVDSPEDRGLLADMLEDGVLELPSVPPGEPVSTDARSVLTERPRGQRYLYTAIVASAACVMLAAGWFAYMSPGDPFRGELLLAQGDNSQINHYLTDAEFASLMDAAIKGGSGGGIDLSNMGGGQQLSPERQRLHDLLKQTHERTPDDLGVLLNYGQVLLEDGNHKRAQELFERASVVDPSSELARLGLGIAQFRQRQYEKAAAVFKELAEQGSYRDTARANLIVCLAATGDIESAQRIWRELPDALKSDRLRALVQQ